MVTSGPMSGGGGQRNTTPTEPNIGPASESEKMPAFPPGVHLKGGRNAAPVHAEAAREFYAPLLALVADLRRRGLSLRAIARELQARQIKSRVYHQWSASQVRRVLARAAAIPTGKPGGETVSPLSSRVAKPPEAPHECCSCRTRAGPETRAEPATPSEEPERTVPPLPPPPPHKKESSARPTTPDVPAAALVILDPEQRQREEARLDREHREATLAFRATGDPSHLERARRALADQLRLRGVPQPEHLG
jgi:hypothetical protein